MKNEVAIKRRQPGQPAIFVLVDGDDFSRHLEEVSKAIAQLAYELFEQDGRRDGHDLEHWYRAESQLLQPVPVEFGETEDRLTVRADIPGFMDKELELRVGPKLLVISSKKEHVFDHRSKDVRPIEICRSLHLSAEIEPNQTTATFKEGRLEVALPKAAEVRKGPMAVNAA
jgi:HSP20 family protein